MKRFKNILSLIAVALAVFLFAPPEAQAQLDISTTTMNGGTNNVAATTTNTAYTVAITVARGSQVAIQPSLKLTGAGTTAIVLKFDESIDNSIWRVAAHTLIVTPAGTAVVNTTTNLTLGAIGFLRLSQIENPNATAITNLTVKYAVKPGL